MQVKKFCPVLETYNLFPVFSSSCSGILFVFVLFKLNKNCRLGQDSNLGRQSRRRVSRPFDHHNGPLVNKCIRWIVVVNKTCSRCPFTKTIPVSVQMCLTSSKKILDGFEVADKKDLTPERMSVIVADTIVRIYDTNLAKLDGLALKTW